MLEVTEGVNSHRLSAVTEMLGWSQEQKIMPELVFHLMQLLLAAAYLALKKEKSKIMYLIALFIELHQFDSLVLISTFKEDILFM